MITKENASQVIAQLEREIAALKSKFLRAKADRQQLQKCFNCQCKCKHYRGLN